MLNLLRQFVGNCPPLLGPGDDSLPAHNAQLLHELRETGIAEEPDPEITHLLEYLRKLPDQVFWLVKAMWETGGTEDVAKHDTLTDKLKPILSGMNDEEYIEFMSDVMAAVIQFEQPI